MFGRSNFQYNSPMRRQRQKRSPEEKRAMQKNVNIFKQQPTQEDDFGQLQPRTFSQDEYVKFQDSKDQNKQLFDQAGEKFSSALGINDQNKKDKFKQSVNQVGEKHWNFLYPNDQKYKDQIQKDLAQEASWDPNNPETQKKIQQLAEQQKLRDQQAVKEGTNRFNELMDRDYEGLTPNQRRVLQESADANINRDIQGYQRNLLAQQGRRGVKGGSAFAQQQDLARLGVNAQHQTQRDLSALDRELAMQKLAAAYNVEQGEVGQEAFRQQMALDTLNGFDEKKYQKYLADQSKKLFERV